MLFSDGYGQPQQIGYNKKCRQIAGNLNCHTDASVQRGAHRPIQHVQGFTLSHWMPPSGECLHLIAPLNAVIGPVFTPYRPSGRHGHRFWRKKLSCGVVKLLFEASVKKARNGPSTQLIKVTSCVVRSNATIKAKSQRAQLTF